MALPAVVLALMLLLCVAKVGTARVAAERAAATAARLVAIGTSPAEVTNAVQRAGGRGASVSTRVEAGWATAEVSIPIVATWGTWQVVAEQSMPTEEYLVGFPIDSAVANASPGEDSP
ncbi:hypothetical protein [Rarobacter faecitabidus]|uniref:hypothetical protein n=1 Tax=Rarobacter faecitabidus TaxID=13243 RepID=UPI00147778FA|nr:hypothetical protein [Rarobacter faecitabidus]